MLLVKAEHCIWQNFCGFCIQLQILNKLFYRFHTRRDDLAIGIRERFPMNGHLHTNCESFPTRKFSYSKVLPYTVVSLVCQIEIVILFLESY